MARRKLEVPVGGGQLVGWVEGSGPPILLLHGGPAISASYLEGLFAELLPGYELAVYQQRGLRPSMEDGPHTVDVHVSDVLAVLGTLHWERAFVLGHSWGGHLALHVAAAHPQRIRGVLAVEALGGVGDGGMSKMQQAIYQRVPEANRKRVKELDQRSDRGELTLAEGEEFRRLIWPAYFANPSAAPPPLMNEASMPAMAATFASLVEGLPALEEALPGITTPFGFVAGERSPMPAELSSEATARRMPTAWVEIVPNAGHFLWLEVPGAIRNALDRLVKSSASVPAGQ